MNDALKILDELESIRSHRRHQTVREICPNRCQALRTAIEAMKNREKNITTIARRWQGKLEEAEKELAQARARIAKLERAHGKGVSKFTYSRPDGSIVTDGDALVRSVTGGKRAERQESHDE